MTMGNFNNFRKVEDKHEDKSSCWLNKVPQFPNLSILVKLDLVIHLPRA